jgi:hypothetical protein
MSMTNLFLADPSCEKWVRRLQRCTWRWSVRGRCSGAKLAVAFWYPCVPLPSKMQRDEQCGVLSRRLAALCVFSELRDREWTIRTKIAVAFEICRLREQVELRSRARCRIWKSFFNINSLSDLECLVRYRFRRKDIGFISEIIPWVASLAPHGRMRTARRRYHVDSVEATAIFLRRLSSPSRWVDLQAEFGKHSACLTELFYHTLELFYSKFGPVIQTWPERLVQRRAANYQLCTQEGITTAECCGFHRRHCHRDCETAWIRSACYIQWTQTSQLCQVSGNFCTRWINSASFWSGLKAEDMI